MGLFYNQDPVKTGLIKIVTLQTLKFAKKFITV